MTTPIVPPMPMGMGTGMDMNNSKDAQQETGDFDDEGSRSESSRGSRKSHRSHRSRHTASRKHGGRSRSKSRTRSHSRSHDHGHDHGDNIYTDKDSRHPSRHRKYRNSSTHHSGSGAHSHAGSHSHTHSRTHSRAVFRVPSIKSHSRSSSPDPSQEAEIRQILEAAISDALPGNKILPPALLKTDPFAAPGNINNNTRPSLGRLTSSYRLANSPQPQLSMQMHPSAISGGVNTYAQIGYLPIQTPQTPSMAHLPRGFSSSSPPSSSSVNPHMSAGAERQLQWQHTPMLSSVYNRSSLSVPGTPAVSVPGSRAPSVMAGGGDPFFPYPPQSPPLSRAPSGITSAALHHKSVSEVGGLSGKSINPRVRVILALLTIDAKS